MASSLDGLEDGSNIKAEEGALLKLGWLERDDAGSEVGPAETLGEHDGELARMPSRWLTHRK